MRVCLWTFPKVKVNEITEVWVFVCLSVYQSVSFTSMIILAVNEFLFVSSQLCRRITTTTAMATPDWSNFLTNDFLSLPHFLWRLCSYPSCSGAKAPGLAADMHFKNDVIAFVGPACAFALEPVARLAAYWNSPIITGMGDQVRCTLGEELQGKCKSFNASEVFSI